MLPFLCFSFILHFHLLLSFENSLSHQQYFLVILPNDLFSSNIGNWKLQLSFTGPA